MHDDINHCQYTAHYTKYVRYDMPQKGQCRGIIDMLWYNVCSVSVKMIYPTLSKLRTAHWALLSISIDKQQHWQITDCSLNFGNLLNENWIYRRCPSQYPLPLNSHSMRPNQNRMEGLVIFTFILIIIKSTSSSLYLYLVYLFSLGCICDLWRK